MGYDMSGGNQHEGLMIFDLICKYWPCEEWGGCGPFVPILSSPKSLTAATRSSSLQFKTFWGGPFEESSIVSWGRNVRLGRPLLNTRTHRDTAVAWLMHQETIAC
eukprot:4998735-Amphidinium_carterae.3